MRTFAPGGPTPSDHVKSGFSGFGFPPWGTADGSDVGEFSAVLDAGSDAPLTVPGGKPPHGAQEPGERLS